MKDLPIAKKSLGQHWLSDETTLESICKAAQLDSSDTVLEIGPGGGTLTAHLTKRAGQVVAVELDRQLASNLAGNKTENLQVVQGDILKFDLTTMPAVYKVVANIPYYLTGKLLRVLSESTNPPELVVLLIQKEVAVRIAAKPGDMSLLSVVTQYYWAVKLGEVVPARLFTPPPKVDSQILILKRRFPALFPEVQPNQFFRLVKAGFAARRKTLLNSLSSALKIGKAETTALLETVQIDPQTRPQELSLEKWHELYKRAVAFL